MKPSARASSMRRRRSWWNSSLFGLSTIVNDSGRPDTSHMSRNIRNSRSRSVKSETSWNTPVPPAPTAAAMPTSSSAAAVRVGVKSPVDVLWFAVRLVEKPRAPAAIPSAARRPIAAMSSAVASSRFAPRSPITWSRNAPWGTWVAMSMSLGVSQASMYSANEFHCHDSPSCSAAPGMSSTPSMSSTSLSWSLLWTGANPTPQFPKTTVVTPCQLDGCIRLSHVAWPS